MLSFVSVALSGAICMGLCACNDGGGKVEEEAENFVSAEVSAEQWASAMEMFAEEDANYTLHYSASLVYDHSKEGNASIIENGQVTIDGGRLLLFVEHLTAKVEANDERFWEGWENLELSNEEFYYERMENGWYAYVKNNEGNWKKNVIRDLQADQEGKTILEGMVLGQIGSFFLASYGSNVSPYDSHNKYEEFLYNKEKNGYYFDMNWDDGTGGILIKINQDDKIAVYSSEENYPDWGGAFTVKLNCMVEYTEREVTLPVVSE